MPPARAPSPSQAALRRYAEDAQHGTLWVHVHVYSVLLTVPWGLIYGFHVLLGVAAD